MDGVGTSIIEMPQTLACRDTPVYLNYRYSYKCEELENPIDFLSPNPPSPLLVVVLKPLMLALISLKYHHGELRKL